MRLICQGLSWTAKMQWGNAEVPNLPRLPAAHSAEPLPLNSPHSPQFLLAMGKRIVNGEIVDDDAPGLHGRSTSSSARPESRHVTSVTTALHAQLCVSVT